MSGSGPLPGSFYWNVVFDDPAQSRAYQGWIAIASGMFGRLQPPYVIPFTRVLGIQDVFWSFPVVNKTFNTAGCSNLDGVLVFDANRNLTNVCRSAPPPPNSSWPTADKAYPATFQQVFGGQDWTLRLNFATDGTVNKLWFLEYAGSTTSGPLAFAPRQP